jgi:glycosyltransferase involved in cell wall biosynthesis
MNILYATDFHNRANSGITFAINELAGQTMAALSPGGSVHLLSIGECDVPVRLGVHHQTAEVSKGPARIWRFAPCYRAICERTISQDSISVVHIHGIWMHPQLAAANAAQRLRVPTVLTHHGHVQWALRQPNRFGAAKKRLYMALVKDRLFRRITVQHAITRHERDALHSFFPYTRIEVIPNFVNLQTVDGSLLSGDRSSAQGSAPYVLYIGRVHPTKGIDVLIEAFGRASVPRDWRLIIAGPAVDQPYAQRLRQLIASSPRADQIEMRGPVWDASAKYRLMRDAWVTIVPSQGHSEVMTLVNLEASACATPTITTKATGLTDWSDGGGLLIESGLQPLAAALSEAAQWSDQERKQRGLASRRLIEKQYSAATVTPRWLDLYRSLH